MGAMKVWDGSSWQNVAPFSARASVYVGPNQPAGTAYAGDMWWDTDDPPPGTPGQELAYNQVTSNVNITATTDATANELVPGTARSYDGTPIIVEFYCGALGTSAVAAAQITVTLWDGSTDLGPIACLRTSAASAAIAAITGRRRITPTVGSHTYRAMAFTGNPTGIAYCNTGGATNLWTPMYVQVTRV